MSALMLLCITPLVLFSLADAVPPPATKASIDMAAACDTLADDIQKKVDEFFASIITAEDYSHITDMVNNDVRACINNVLNVAQDQFGLSSTNAEPDESVILYFLSSPGYYLPGTAANGTGKGN